MKKHGINKRLIAERELLSAPADDILELISYYKISKAQLAKRMGIRTSEVYNIISGKEPITINTALQIEKMFGISSQYWLKKKPISA